MYDLIYLEVTNLNKKKGDKHFTKSRNTIESLSLEVFEMLSFNSSTIQRKNIISNNIVIFDIAWSEAFWFFIK